MADGMKDTSPTLLESWRVPVFSSAGECTLDVWNPDRVTPYKIGGWTIYASDSSEKGGLKTVCHGTWDEYDLEIQQRISRLLHAAPDMLTALLHARQQIQHPDQMIDDAIAKATSP